MDLEGRVALVTGAARRVGRAIAECLAQAGCHVAVHCRASVADADDLVGFCRAQGVQAERFVADLSQAAAAAGLVPRVLKRFERLDALISNASVFERTPLEEFDPACWQRTLQVNVVAPMILAHAARDALRQARGCIVHLCDAGTDRPWPDYLAYMVSKGALDTLTRGLARALAPEVRVVGVAPGIAAWPEHYSEALRERLVRKTLLRRAGTPGEVAAVVKFLLTQGDYITGVILPVDGGRGLV